MRSNRFCRQSLVTLIFAGIALGALGQKPSNKVAWDVFRNGTLEQVQTALRSGYSVKARTEDGQTPLMIAASSNPNPGVIGALIKAKSDIRAKDREGRTAIFYALDNGNGVGNNVLFTLIKAGAAVNSRDEIGETPLMKAVRGPFTSFPVCGEGDPLNFEAEKRTASEKSDNNVDLLIKAGADVNAKNIHGWTALFYVWDPRVTKRLLAAGASVNVISEIGETPLMRAIEKNFDEVVSVLIDAGANVNAKSRYGKTPLSVAASDPCGLCVVKKLVMAGANLEMKDESGWTALDYACEAGNTETVDFLTQADQEQKEKGAKQP